jgi:tetratricopeptide (TPR) repeat protein
MAAELVLWNNGPIKAVSLTGAYRVYILNPTNFHVSMSMGISPPLVDYTFSLPELKPTGESITQLLSASSPALYVVNFEYYRETDMEHYSAQDYFLFENDAFYDRDSLKGRTNYNALMYSLLYKMKWDAQAGSSSKRVIDPPLPGTSTVNFNILNVPEEGSPEWGPIISNKTSEVAADPRNPEVYVRRGTSFHLMHRLAEAAADYEKAIELGCTNFQCYNNLSAIRSTSTNSILRNGREAISLAERACELTGWNNWEPIGNLADAYAETDDFVSAAKYEREAITKPELLPLEREVAERALARMLNHLPTREGSEF